VHKIGLEIEGDENKLLDDVGLLYMIIRLVDRTGDSENIFYLLQCQSEG
jgi:hypothetical protein